MSNIGFDNWEDDSEEVADYSLSSEGGFSPPSYKPSTTKRGGNNNQSQSSSQSQQQRRTNRSQEQDEYAFDLSDDNIEYQPSISKPSGGVKSERAVYHEMGPSRDSSTKAAPSRRMSTDDRMKEILARQQQINVQQSSVLASEKYEEPESAAKWEQMRASIMEGVTDMPSSSTQRASG